MNKKILTTLLLLMFCSNYAFAKILKEKFNKRQPINITSEKVEIFRNKNEIIFVNNVKAIHNKFILYADRMIVKYQENNNKKIDIKSIKTLKNVQFINEDIKATGNEGFYDIDNNILTLKNNVTATESGITVYAEEFEYNINTGKTKIIGNKKQNERVTLILDNIEELKNRD